MRLLVTLLFALSVTIFSASCKRDAASTTDATTTTAPDASGTTPAAVPSAATPATAAAGGVKHYICPNNCANSGGDVAGTCPTCGTTYLHNDAFHNQASTTPAQPSVTAPQNVTAPAAPNITMPQSNDPAQNAAGVWHYTCTKGCAGGSGGMGKCAKCGGDLAHNAAYHN
jgi:hypothetical protein